jgi:hypothetical protein
MYNEEELRIIWRKGLISAKPLKTQDGIELEVLSPGEENMHAGPDFFCASIRIDRLVWAGNVEIHRSSSDWNKHLHQLDPAYDNVILHVVHTCDVQVRNSKGRLIPTLVVVPSDFLLERVHQLKKNESWITCGSYYSQVPESILKPWLPKLFRERMEIKKEQLVNSLSRHGFDWKQTLYLAMASGFGLPINSLPFELLASKIPLAFILEVKEDLMNLEALFFGYSGMLQTSIPADDYIHSLQQRYANLRKELPATPLPGHVWKFLRIRPAAFPTIRLSQFASLIHSSIPFKADPLELKSISEIESLLQVSASDYWNTHYIFGRRSSFSVKKLGQQGRLQLLINILLPFFELMQSMDGYPKFSFLHHEHVNKLNGESNHIIKNWINFGVNPNNAVESQALIQLYKSYCLPGRCKDCVIGRDIF